VKHGLTTVIKQSEALIFDLFHTLISFPTKKTFGQSTSEILGVDKTAWTNLLFHSSTERLKGFITDPIEIMTDLARRLDPTIDDATIKKATEFRMEKFKQRLIDVPEKNIALILALKHAGKKVALISNADVTEKVGWDDSPLKNIFDHVIFSCDVGLAKPEKEIYDLSVQALNITPEEAIFIGDGGSNELQGAKTAGLTTIMTIEHIQHIWPEAVKTRRKIVDFVIEDLNELKIW